MIVLNPGNVLALYKEKKQQNRFIGNCERNAICAPLGLGIPWQYIVPNTVGTVAVHWEDENGVVIPATGDINASELSTGVTVLTYYGAGLAGPTKEGYYTLVLTIDGQTCYFEEQYLKADISCYSRVAFSNDCNMKNIYYDSGYVQSFYFKGYEDTPTIDKQETAKINGRGEIQIKAGSTVKSYCNIFACDIIDPLIYPLSLIRHHSSVIYYPDQTGLAYPNIKEFDIVFTPSSDSCYQNANISFLTDYYQDEGCCPVDVSVVQQNTITL